jgi:hypothetical protein
MSSLDLFAIMLQSLFLIIFIVPTQSILRKHWNHLDGFSKWMVMIYILDMVSKLVFFILTYLIEDLRSNETESQNIKKSLMRAAHFIVNSLFTLSLHMFVLKL